MTILAIKLQKLEAKFRKHWEKGISNNSNGFLVISWRKVWEEKPDKD